MQAQLGQRLLAVLDGMHRESLEREELGEDLANHSLVVDDEDPRGFLRLCLHSIYCCGAGAGAGAPEPSLLPPGPGCVGFDLSGCTTSGFSWLMPPPAAVGPPSLGA